MFPQRRKLNVDIMKLLIIFACCWAAATLAATAGDAQKAAETSFLPRYTLLAESKKKEQDLEREPGDASAGGNEQQQPWRRLAYASYNNHASGWPASSAPGASLSALMAPGLMLLGVNLGALLYMLLALLGLAPPQRFGTAWHTGDIYRNDRQGLGAGKEMDMYF